MTPTDAGPLFALFNAHDKHHGACARAVRSLTFPLVTTWPCLTEAMYFLGKSLGHAAQDDLWEMVTDGRLLLHPLSENETARMRVLMTKYKSTPMDLADASLVVMCETLNARVIFTVDSDFYVYRLADGRALRLVP